MTPLLVRLGQSLLALPELQKIKLSANFRAAILRRIPASTDDALTGSQLTNQKRLLPVDTFQFKTIEKNSNFDENDNNLESS